MKFFRIQLHEIRLKTYIYIYIYITELQLLLKFGKKALKSQFKIIYRLNTLNVVRQLIP